MEPRPQDISPRSFGPGEVTGPLRSKPPRWSPPRNSPLRSGDGIDIVRRQFGANVVPGRERFLQEIQAWLGPVSRVETAEFEIYGIEEIASAPLTIRLDIRYDIVATRNDERREERVGSWRTEWSRDESEAWKARRWEASEETLSVAHGPVFIDVTPRLSAERNHIQSQMLRGVRLLAYGAGWRMRH